MDPNQLVQATTSYTIPNTNYLNTLTNVVVKPTPGLPEVEPLSLVVVSQADLGVSHMGMGMAQNSTQKSGGVRKNIEMTDFTMPNNISSIKYAQISVLSLADVWVSHGDGDGPRTQPRCLEWSGKASND